ncbi:alpha/beta fold hydrolase [Streptomyces botrytidirepellens]|uniref:alpha/beta fold hydrolase n=1 Tax=Streptomyces botrytidirepellens TaxID=2486417 RepID=UPI001FE699E2|nr:alpha/beta fold hydrolase [Streptomyces botrytidirepellens]
MGYSLGANLAVHYASEHPDAVAGLVLIDGANPLPEPFITEPDQAEFRAMADNLAQGAEHNKGTAHQVLLTAQQIHDLNLEIDVVRSAILDRYRKIDHPISLIMSTSLAGGQHRGPCATAQPPLARGHRTARTRTTAYLYDPARRRPPPGFHPRPAHRGDHS